MLARPYTLQYGHDYCYSCLHQWFKEANSCPDCRIEISREPCLVYRVRSLFSLTSVNPNISALNLLQLHEIISNAMEQSRDAGIRRDYHQREAEAATAIARNTANRHLLPTTSRSPSESPFDIEAWGGDNGESLVDETAMAGLEYRQGSFAPITIGPSDPCPICARPEHLLQEGMCGNCGFGT